MKKAINIADLFPKHLFWDMDHSKLHPVKDKAIIIPRALYSTTLHTFEEDIQKLELLYSSTDIIKYLMLTKENISNKVCKLVSERYQTAPFQRYALTA